ncbi:uncharacterized protein LOC141672362 [Apium graveolens]|uniref:uncharacterized protein LOC141672362 n=1 Tax=Apium graveolens TaxID=4045 RepID=UPI003D7A2FED
MALMGSTNFIFAGLKNRSSTFPNCLGQRNSAFVPVSSSPVITQIRGNNIQMEAATEPADTIDHDIMQQQEVDEELMLAAGLREEAMPKHVAILPDGHSRWAKQRGQPVQFGHETLAPVNEVICRLCCKFGIKVLTSYLSSTETWHRSKDEVDYLMILFEEGMRSNLEKSIKEGIRISIIGDRTKLPESLLEAITEAEEITKVNSRLHLILAIGYGGRNEIVRACKNVCKRVKDGLIGEEEIDEKIFEQELETSIAQYPLDLLIRPAGEFRLSNFFLYQSAYAELYFTKTLSPDFEEEDFIRALKSYQERNRRYGKRP